MLRMSKEKKKKKKKKKKEKLTTNLEPTILSLQ